jgi:hypothetical protein
MFFLQSSQWYVLLFVVGIMDGTRGTALFVAPAESIPTRSLTGLTAACAGFVSVIILIRLVGVVVQEMLPSHCTDPNYPYGFIKGIKIVIVWFAHLFFLGRGSWGSCPIECFSLPIVR